MPGSTNPTTKLPGRENGRASAPALPIDAVSGWLRPRNPPSLRGFRRRRAETARAARLVGGGCSLERTRLRAEFPGNREIYREFRASGAVLRRSNREEVPANRPLLGIRKLLG